MSEHSFFDLPRPKIAVVVCAPAQPHREPPHDQMTHLEHVFTDFSLIFPVRLVAGLQQHPLSSAKSVGRQHSANPSFQPFSVDNDIPQIEQQPPSSGRFLERLEMQARFSLSVNAGGITEINDLRLDKPVQDTRCKRARDMPKARKQMHPVKMCCYLCMRSGSPDNFQQSTTLHYLGPRGPEKGGGGCHQG